MKLNHLRSKFARHAARAMAVSLVAMQVHAATLSIPNVPVFLGTVVPPNVSFVLDNSGSMAWTWLPDVAILFRTTNSFQFSNGGPLIVDNFNNYWMYQSTVGPTDGRYGLYSNHCNGAYFNPATTYTPPLDAAGVPYPNSNYNAAPIDGFNPALGTLNLATLTIRAGFAGGHYFAYTGTQPARDFQYTSSGAVIGNTFFTECNSAVGTPPGNAVFTLVNVNTASAAVQQNYANWFSYYRTRMLAMKSAAGRAFAGLNDSYRVGFQTINFNNTNFLPTKPFDPVHKTNWFKRFYGIVPAGSTPLRTALRNAGEYYRTGTMPGVSPATADPVLHSCQKNYTILSSDGFWNDAFAGVGNRDLTVPPLPAPITGLTPGASWPFPYIEGTTAASDTLADIATFYWATDLRTGPGWPNNVPGDVSDPASWQHMTTYTLGFGIKGTLPYPGALPGLTTGATRWPTPVFNQATAVDDLWHAGINGFGGYLSAQDPAELTTALRDALNDVAARVTSSSSVAANTTSIQTGTRVYQARFDSSNWTGQLLSYTLSAAGAVSGTFEWDAAIKLMAQTAASSDSRIILTYNGGGVPFQWGSLSSAQQNALRTPPSGGPTLDAASVGQQRLEYLRGWSANEGSGVGQFRARTVSKLGDIIDSNPWYVGQPQAGYSDDDHPGYAAFRASNLTRKPVIYLGANDGMLHGFDASFDPVTNLPTATSGNEVLGYVPARVFGKLSKLTSQTYNSSHQYFVNSSPMVGDADFSSTGADWKTVLVSGLGQGGQGYFALNVTDPASFAESNAASLVLWEFTDRDDQDLGYTFNQPTVNSLNKLSAQIVKMNNNKWAVVIGNGYNNTEADGNASTTGHAVLYILYLSNTFGGTWTLGTDYIKITTGSGTLASPNGLATPLPVDTNGDGKVDLIYAGDINGNMWKFDVSSASPASWAVANAGSPLFTAPAGQPITSAPQVFPHPNGGRMVLFGTGKFIETADASGPFTTQALYGVWDNGGTVTLSDLVAQTVIDTVSGAGTSFRRVSSNTVDYAGAPPAKGWFLNLPATGETVPFNTLIKSGLALFSSMIPSPDPCAFGGEGWLMALDPLTGWASAYGSFDADGDGSITATESVTTGGGATVSVAVAGRKSTVGIAPTPTILDVPSAAGGVYGSGGGGGGGMVYANGTGGLERFGLQDQPGSRGRIMWKEIFQ